MVFTAEANVLASTHFTTREVNAMPARSAITGKYVKQSTADRHPKTIVVEKPAPKKSGK